MAVGRSTSGWTKGEVTLAQALGLPPAQDTTLDTTLPAQVGDALSQQQQANLTPTVTPANPGGTPAIGNCNSATTTKNKQLMAQEAAKYGWGPGSAYWGDLDRLVMSESGYCNTIKNPTSTAYGIGQFLDTTWATVGGSKTSDALTQIRLMLKYVKTRYGNPSKAWSFHVANNYY